MTHRTAAIWLGGLALLTACGAQPDAPTHRAPMSNPSVDSPSAVADQRPSIDRAAPAKFETATFALG